MLSGGTYLSHGIPLFTNAVGLEQIPCHPPFPPLAAMAEKEKRKTDRQTEKQATNSSVVEVFFEFTI